MNRIDKETIVYITDEYDLFKQMPGNRNVSRMRVDKLKASFMQKDIANPIKVNENMEIVDGQGRYEARKELGLPIRYIVIPGLDVKDCALLNRYNSKWMGKDWVESWSQSSDPKIAGNYQRLKNAAIETKMSYTRILGIVGKGQNDSKEKTSVFESGRLVFTDADAETLRDVCAEGEEILTALQFTGRVAETFWRALVIARRAAGYSHKRMVRNCAVCRGSYNQMSNLESELKEFSRIYNFKRSSGRTYFEDYMRNRGYAVRDYAKDNAVTLMDAYTAPNASTLRA